MLLTNKTRTSFLSDVFDDVLYDKKTYADLPHDGPIFLNATDATDGGKRVVFSRVFLHTLHSPIQDIRLATAVATSAAFPGVFDSVTFERFRPKTPSCRSSVPNRANRHPTCTCSTAARRQPGRGNPVGRGPDAAVRQ
jgi:hypothetical protein